MMTCRKENEKDEESEEGIDSSPSISEIFARSARSSLAIMEDLEEELRGVSESADDPGFDLKGRIDREECLSCGELMELLNFIEEKVQAARIDRSGDSIEDEAL